VSKELSFENKIEVSIATILTSITLILGSASWWCDDRLADKDDHVQDVDARIAGVTADYDLLKKEHIQLKNDYNQLVSSKDAKRTQQISLVSALYGGKSMIDHTEWFAAKCDGQNECIFAVMLDKELGDHEPFVRKALNIVYNCEHGKQDKPYHLPAVKEPAKQEIRLVCS
jgi:hypothetical protein